MLAKVKTPFRGVPDGLIHPRDFAAGDIVEGDLAAVAVAEGWAATEESDGAGGVALDKMKVEELKAHATSLSIDLGAAKTKAEIIAVIVAATSGATE
ncbi:hypothetical protein IB277_06590 [Ensifer sp. ENS07]|uniref:hypothetical protein n=1 Tax=Ensifer sp. ENS07 TaxID=2769274 RepID=UPI001786D2B9|nr:hypothetical protein [Ensifer sp. ENS07]MBD9635961.1 hypothetical protein [Ensifer sp. ENS07]